MKNTGERKIILCSRVTPNEKKVLNKVDTEQMRKVQLNEKDLEKVVQYIEVHNKAPS